MADEVVEPVAPVAEPAVAPLDVTPPAVEGEPAPVTAPAEPTPASPLAPAEGDRRTAYQKRINELTRQRRDAERDAEYWRTQAQRGAIQPAAPTAPVGEPRADQYATTDEYVRALARHEANQLIAAREQERIAETVVHAAQEARAKFEPLIEAARGKYEDFDEVTSAPIYTEQTQQLIYSSPQGAEIAYHLGLNPAEADRINRLGVVAAAREIAKLEVRFSTPPPAKTVSSAPPPVKPVAGVAPVEKDIATMTVEEYMAYRRKQLAG